MPTLSILALGSRGDVQPYVALGKGLLDAGYRVRVVTFESFAPLVRGQGLEFHAVPGDAEALVRLAAGAGLTGTRNPLRMLNAVRQTYAQLIEDYIAAFSADALRDSDAIIDQLPGGLFGRDLAEALRVPHIVASVIPLVPTREFPNPLLLAQPQHSLVNRISYSFAAQSVWTLFRGGITRFRRKLGLAAAPRFMPQPPDPVINGFSPRVVPRPRDWGAHVHITGWWTLDESGWQPPADLLAFLNAGEPPVYIGFGSMPVNDPAAVTALLLETLHQTELRGIVARGWANLGGASLPEHVFALDYAPFDWLLPRMAAVVHHGGSGTTGLALRAGVPSMVVPFTADQPYWGTRIHVLGVGPAPLPVQRLTAQKLGRELTTMVYGAPMRERARMLGAALREEQGIANAVELVRTLVPL